MIMRLVRQKYVEKPPIGGFWRFLGGFYITGRIRDFGDIRLVIYCSELGDSD